MEVAVSIFVIVPGVELMNVLQNEKAVAGLRELARSARKQLSGEGQLVIVPTNHTVTYQHCKRHAPSTQHCKHRKG